MNGLLSLFLLLCVRQGCSEVSVHQEDIKKFSDHDEKKPDVPPELHSLWDELLGLKELVLSLKAAEVGQRQAQRSMETQLRDWQVESERQRRRLDQLEDTLLRRAEEPLMEPGSSLRRRVEKLEVQSEAQAAEVSTLRSRMNSSESSFEEHVKKSTATATELPFLQMRLRASERTLEVLKRKNAVLALRVCSTEELIEELMKQTSEFQVSNSSSELERHVDVRLEELSATTHAVHCRLNGLEQNFTKSAERLELFIHNQLSVIDSRLNSSQNHLDQLKINAADQGRRLGSAQTRVDELQVENRGQWDQISSIESRLRENHTEALEVRLKVSEEQLEELRTEHTALRVRLGSAEQRLDQLKSHADGLQVQLSGGGATLDQLKISNADVVSRLEAAQVVHTALERRLSEANVLMMKLQVQTSELKVELGAVQEQLDDVQAAEKSGQLKVAFSAGLTDSGSVGPFDEETTLIFSKPFSNVGGAYNQSTGVFTAPVRGLYFFSFTAGDYLRGYTGLYLYRNNKPVLFNLGLNNHGGHASMSSGVVLMLEEGDVVCLHLPASYRLYDDSQNLSCFSGFLLFSL
ncbi:EMILIN-1-A-like isoform X2 [Takifugu flavidus]|uniref:EMILIN-1-A-like isoform X2 n=1 Tax=Takifugu flavidus TaxID=433684 RepID=UPI002544AA49|nr:EMILIN-1-A-like isoform X2 [Takifugu flavidus]